MEAIPVSIDKWMDKKNVLYSYNGILFSLKDGNSVICYKMDEPWEIMLSEICQSQKEKSHMIPLTWGFWSSHKETKWWLPGSGRKGQWEVIVWWI